MHQVVVQSQNELNQCLDIRREVFIIEQQVPEDLEVDEYDALDTEVTHVLIYDDNHRPVATARLKPYKEGGVKVERVAVRQAHRKKGYGATVMQLLERLAADNGFLQVVLDAQYHALDFYKKLGYETVSEMFIEAGIEHVQMTKPLK